MTNRFIVLVALLSLAPGANAQRCLPSSSSNEADVFGIRSLSLAMSRGTAIAIESPGTVRVGGEAVFLPTIDARTARPTACRPGKGSENVNALPAAGRLRVSVALPRQLSIEASWLPPVTLKGMRANLLGLALEGQRRLTDRWVLGVRGHGTIGHITGPFTCPESAVHDERSECFGGTESADEFSPNIVGADVGLGFNAPTSRFAWFAGGGYSRLMPRFRVHFRDATGFLDTTRVIVDLNRIALFGGVSTSIGQRLRMSAEFYGTTSDGVTGRIIVDGIVRNGR